MARLLVLILIATSGAALFAQDSADMSGSVPSDRRITRLYEIDFGPSSTSWTVGVSLTTNASTGLVVRLVDVDALASSSLAEPTAIDEFSISGAGTAAPSLTGNYSGVHCFAIEIETQNGSTAADYSGTITTSAGDIEFVVQDQMILSASGTRVSVGKFAFWDRSVPPGSTVPASLELDFGAEKTVFIRLEAYGNGIEEIEFVDTTGGNGTVLATFNNPGAGDETAVSLTHSGKATLRVNVRGQSPGGGSGSWVVNVPCGIEISRVGVPGEGGGGGNGECSTGEGRGWIMLTGLLALAIVLRPSRRRARARDVVPGATPTSHF